ncbi:hypothetical protein PUNSTDRAFT_49220 [Punctularia strigosozonata HHB-11173 SS5]|uniref:uncharacterized protein n=1 Tax=Punctularia strigosozonata (strain HHB-11173) TaxID=741275 RepID=UPI000441639C|nr:uncharacterized protein PUNSTDRAFT_49220 [Punctularia strigosozonata HHB-11173 SS5]EIN14430.1 hypothetical protein PUNSTDRAFT_49220 [Punctularia strigosozonata HHB-11173 SS5]
MASTKTHVRLATEGDVAEMALIARRAFMTDPEFNYFGGLREPPFDPAGRRCHHLEEFFRFLIKASYRLNGRLTVVVVSHDASEAIASFTLWQPPGKRLSLLSIWTLLRSGVVSGIRGWGMSGVKRVGIEYGNKCEVALEEAFKSKAGRASHKSSWYLLLACTDPQMQGKGYMSLLMKDIFGFTGAASTYTLEATTPKSRDQYAHFGFEVVKEIALGDGKVNSRGIPPAPGELASGVTIYSMVKWANADNNDNDG